MRNLNENGERYEKWRYYATVSVCVLSLGAVAYLIFKYALPIAVPFLAAFAVGSVVSPTAEYLSKKTKIPRCVWGAALTVVLIALAVTLAILAFDRLISELIHFLENLNRGEGVSIIDRAAEYVSGLTSRLPILRELRASMGDSEFWENLDGTFKSSIEGTVERLAEKIPAFLGRLAANLPETFITFIVTLIATFYFSAGRGKEQLAEIVPERARGRLSAVGKRLKTAAVGWLRAYLVIFLITFVELFAGLSVLRVKYAFLLAVLIATVDILPILGTGTVLIPWAVISLLMKNIRLGIGLLVLFGVITVVREVVEPKIVGKSLGISPILALISMYAGLKLFGFAGMIIVPAAATLAASAIGEDKKKTIDKSEKM